MTVFFRNVTILLLLSVLFFLGASASFAQSTSVFTRSAPDAKDAVLPWALAATLSEPTSRYPHNVLGEIPAFTTLTVEAQLCQGCPTPKAMARLELPAPLVFEDVAPRLWDITGDGRPEIVVVQSHENLGARLTVWALREAADHTSPLFRMIAATDFIGTRFRWLAPFGVGDFTGDGRIEIAYVETPHLGKVLRLVGIEGDKLVERASLAGVTNHRIGEEMISGGVRNCSGQAEAVLASSNWRRIVAVQWQDGALISRDLGPLSDIKDLTRALTCP